MFRTTSRTDRTNDAGTETVTVSAQVAADRPVELRLKATEAATATAAGAAIAKDKATEAAGLVKEYAHEAAETLAPKVEQARDTFIEDVLPKIASALAAIAAGAAAAKESAAEAAERAPDAYAVLKGDAVAKQQRGSGRWILLLGALAAGAAVMAWRKSNERPDPWATAGSYTPPKPVSEKVTGLAGVAKDKAAEVKAAAAEKAAELKGRAADAKGTSTKSAGSTGAGSTGTDTVGTESTVTDTTGPAGDTLGETAPVIILSDAEIEAGAFDDVTAAADADDDTAIPALSETSEGADLSTPNLDNGSSGSTDRI